MLNSLFAFFLFFPPLTFLLFFLGVFLFDRGLDFRLPFVLVPDEADGSKVSIWENNLESLLYQTCAGNHCLLKVNIS